MAKENEQLQQQAANASTTNRDKWIQNMRGKYPDVQDEDELYARSMEGYDMEHEAVKRYNEETNTLNEILNENPDLAGVFSEIFERGKDGNPAGALRNLPPELKRYITDEEYGDEAYLADRKKRADEEKAKADKDSRVKQLREQAGAEVMQELNMSEEDFIAALDAIGKVINNPCETLDQCKEQLSAFLNMVNYDTDVATAETRGRNANIIAQRRRAANRSDGMANSGSAAASVQPKRKGQTIFDVARDAE